jgi:hypothetical protein
MRNMTAITSPVMHETDSWSICVDQLMECAPQLNDPEFLLGIWKRTRWNTYNRGKLPNTLMFASSILDAYLKAIEEDQTRQIPVWEFKYGGRELNTLLRFRSTGMLGVTQLIGFASGIRTPFSESFSLTSATSSSLWVVPGYVREIIFEGWGAGGGSGATEASGVNGYSGAGGGGGYTKCRTAVTPGTTIRFVVGGSGTALNSSNKPEGGPGGGLTGAFLTSGTPILSNALAIAPGGGGGGANRSANVRGSPGGPGGGVKGVSGTTYGPSAGTGGTQSSGGLAGTINDSGAHVGSNGTNGAELQGGDGGSNGGVAGAGNNAFAGTFGGNGGARDSPRGGGGVVGVKYGGGGGEGGATSPAYGGAGGGGGSYHATGTEVTTESGSGTNPGGMSSPNWGSTAGIAGASVTASNSNGNPGNPGKVYLQF